MWKNYSRKGHFEKHVFSCTEIIPTMSFSASNIDTYSYETIICSPSSSDKLSTPQKQSRSVETQTSPKYDNFDSDICSNICFIEEPNRTPETLVVLIISYHIHHLNLVLLLLTVKCGHPI